MSHFAAMKSPVPVAAAATDAKSPLFCPKPRRPVAPLRCHQSDAGMDLLDLLLSKVRSLRRLATIYWFLACLFSIGSLMFLLLFLVGRGEQSVGSVPAATTVLRLAAAARLESGGPRQPVRHGLPGQSHAVVACDVAGDAGAGGRPPYATPSADPDGIPALRGRVCSRVPACRPR
jgi:hypothetical protein